MNCIKQRAEQAKQARPTLLCEDCGKVLPWVPYRKVNACRRCLRERAQKRRRTLDENLPKVNCAYCGQPFRLSHWSRWQGTTRFCSKSCQSKMYHETHGWSKDKVRDKILEYLRNKGSYVGIEDICSALRISEKSIYRFGLSLPQLNYEAGTGSKPDDRFEQPGSLQKAVRELLQQEGFLNTDQICARLQIGRHTLQHRQVSVKNLYQELHLNPPSPHSREDLEERIVGWLRQQKQFCGTARILKALHIDFDCTWRHFAFDTDDLNRKAGHTRTKFSWYEERTWRELKAQFGDRGVIRQKVFEDCRSVSGWRLRFDFFLRRAKALVEVDGSQHTDPSNGYYTERLVENDRLKEEYAAQKRIPLFHLPCTPAQTFEERLMQLVNRLQELSNGCCKTP
jgi:very-short-patch-repair endonuclease